MLHNNQTVVDPLCIILVKNGSKGDRLLFRYPYKEESTKIPIPMPTSKSLKSSTEDPAAEEVLSIGLPRGRKVSDILLSAPPLDSFDESSLESHGILRSSGSSSSTIRSRSRTTPPSLMSRRSPMDKDKSLSNEVFLDPVVVNSGGGMAKKEKSGGKKTRFSPGGNEMLSELSDQDLSNLLAVNSDLSERKFELKLNFVRFVGHPTLMHHPKDIRPVNPLFQTSVKLFHIVFCLNAVASHSIVKCFHDLSKRLGIALRHEEYRCGFLNQEMKKMITMHDEATVHPEEREDEIKFFENLFDDILSKSKVAQLMKRVYDDVVARGSTFVRVNNWVQISFCLPQKIHTLPFRTHAALVEPEAIHRCLEAIRPYHAILLLVNPDDLIGSLWLDASSTIPRLLHVYSPLKSLQTMAADADLTLSQVVEIASHLVYWAQATVIYPLCESNIYVVAPDFPLTSEKLKSQFNDVFPGLSLGQTLADFSLPMPLGERINPVVGGNSLQAQLVQVVIWMLKHHLLIHVHTYVYLTTYFDGSMMDSGMDYLAAFTGDPDGSAFSLNIRPFEVEEDDATASDTFSETTADEMGAPSQDLDPLNPTLIPSMSTTTDQVAGEVAVPASTPTEVKSTNAEKSASNTTTEENQQDTAKDFKGALSELSEAVRRAVSIVKIPLTVQDIRLFSRLSKYLTGDFHFEEIMYRENVRRSQLMLLLDKFREVLVIVEKEDADINFFQQR